MVARCGLSRWVSTSDLLDRSSRLFRRSAVTRSTRSPPSVVRLFLRGAGSEVSSGASTAGGAGGGVSIGADGACICNSAMGGDATAGGVEGSSRRPINATYASMSGACGALAGVAMRINRSVPCNNASMCSGRSNSRFS